MNKKYFGRNGHSLEPKRDPIKQTIIDLKNSYNMNGDRSPLQNKMTSSSSVFNYSSTSSQTGNAPYWDLLSLDDVREHEKFKVKERDAKLRAQRHLRSCLEDQMREHSLKSNILKLQNRQNHELVLDRMSKLEIEHDNKVSWDLWLKCLYSASNTLHLSIEQPRNTRTS